MRHTKQYESDRIHVDITAHCAFFNLVQKQFFQLVNVLVNGGIDTIIELLIAKADNFGDNLERNAAAHFKCRQMVIQYVFQATVIRTALHV